MSEAQVSLDRILERLDNLITTNTKEHEAMEHKRDIARTELNNIFHERDKRIENIYNRVEELERWKIGFVAKFSVYSAIALFFGSAIATLAVKFLGDFI